MVSAAASDSRSRVGSWIGRIAPTNRSEPRHASDCGAASAAGAMRWEARMTNSDRHPTRYAALGAVLWMLVANVAGATDLRWGGVLGSSLEATRMPGPFRWNLDAPGDS